VNKLRALPTGTRQLTAPPDHAVVSGRGAHRWSSGHPWIYRSDILRTPDGPPRAVPVLSEHNRPLGWALWSPASEISLRLLDLDPNASIDAAWWHRQIATAIERRKLARIDATACRLIHGEADGCPSLVCDRYDRWLVVQLLSAGLEHYRTDIISALSALLQPDGILARNDVAVRRREGLEETTELLAGDVPRDIEVVEHGVKYLAAPWTGQKTGAFLDQRENRFLAGTHARGRALDCFSYHGSFALHLARHANSVIALDTSAAALERGMENARINGYANVDAVRGDAFEYLKQAERDRSRFDMVVLDPPAFAKTRSAVASAIRGYKEINLRGMRILAPGGTLFTASCSFHLDRAAFWKMLAGAAADSGRRMQVLALVGQPVDHPEVLTIPETGYIKGAILQAQD
jgi:23S rRNA (cytosine1962-C5)-methyltransferase